MAKFIVLKDIAILDKGVGNLHRFTAIDGVFVDEYGALDAKSLKSAKSALSNEAVKNGAIRIHQSDCVDMSGNLEASDDMIVAFNGGDIVYSSLQTGFKIEKFMIKNSLLLPATKFKVPRISINGNYPAASTKDLSQALRDIVQFLPSASFDEINKIIDLILEESRIVYFSNQQRAEVLRG
jgi:hypothetical protein